VIRARERIFDIAITATGRVLLVRDRLLGRIGRGGSSETPGTVSRHAIPSGSQILDAVLVTPDANSARASLLICHGIGETVEHWLAVQQLLAANGVASLVFDYSGYGRSSGFFNSNQSEQDAIAAFAYLQQLTTPLPVSLLGFSLGSGIACAIIHKVPAYRLVLCAAFTSLRKAAASIGFPKFLVSLVPPVWDAKDALCNCPVPVLVVHGERDRLFPVRMAQELIALCGSQSELVIVPTVAHNQPFRRPQLSYWEAIISWVLAADGTPAIIVRSQVPKSGPGAPGSGSQKLTE
jgi:pimeloyl-ACP methyl ester carboxylesterase